MTDPSIKDIQALSGKDRARLSPQERETPCFYMALARKYGVKNAIQSATATARVMKVALPGFDINR